MWWWWWCRMESGENKEPFLWNEFFSSRVLLSHTPRHRPEFQVAPRNQQVFGQDWYLMKKCFSQTKISFSIFQTSFQASEWFLRKIFGITFSSRNRDCTIRFIALVLFFFTSYPQPLNIFQLFFLPHTSNQIYFKLNEIITHFLVDKYQKRGIHSSRYWFHHFPKS